MDLLCFSLNNFTIIFQFLLDSDNSVCLTSEEASVQNIVRIFSYKLWRKIYIICLYMLTIFTFCRTQTSKFIAMLIILSQQNHHKQCTHYLKIKKNKMKIFVFLGLSISRETCLFISPPTQQVLLNFQNMQIMSRFLFLL